MSEINLPPLESEVWFKDGKPTRHAYQFFDGLNSAIISQGIFPFARYADLADVNNKLPNPIDGFTVMFTGQGLGTYKVSISQWVLSSDDTTLIV